MVESASMPSRLIDRLPPVRGALVSDAALAKATWFRVGGPAEVLFRPADRDDLIGFLGNMPADVPVTFLGAGTNVLVRDGGIPGVVIRLGKAFATIEVAGTDVLAGAAAMDINVARAAARHAISGLEFLSGIPGTVGGAVRMNAGAFGREVRDAIVSAEAISRDGTVHSLSADELGLGYRSCGIPDDWIFVAARFRGHSGAIGAIEAEMRRIRIAREDSQPIRTRTGGSTFANPAEEESGGLRAWELIDRAGCRGLARGGAAVSNLHCNFLINTGHATAADIEGLGEEVRRRVSRACGVTLHWEIRRLGRYDSGSKARPVQASDGGECGR
jgi:UDP-N-acetylmuramate dehydrogenase